VLLSQDEEIEDPGGEGDREAGADVGPESRSFLESDAAAVHSSRICYRSSLAAASFILRNEERLSRFRFN